MLVHAHSGLRWVVLVLIVMSIVSAFGGTKGGKVFDGQVKKLALYTLISMHVQILLGLILYFTSPKVQFGASMMSDSYLRFFAVEHIFMMIIAVVLITIGYSKSKKKKTDVAKHKTIFWFYLIAFVLIIASIPWPFRTALDAGWF